MNQAQNLGSQGVDWARENPWKTAGAGGALAAGRL